MSLSDLSKTVIPTNASVWFEYQDLNGNYVPWSEYKTKKEKVLKDALEAFEAQYTIARVAGFPDEHDNVYGQYRDIHNTAKLTTRQLAIIKTDSGKNKHVYTDSKEYAEYLLKGEYESLTTAIQNDVVEKSPQ